MRKILVLLVAAAAFVTVALAVPATAGGKTSTAAAARNCAAQFDRAQRTDMVSFRDFDATTFRRGHDPAALSIGPRGGRYVGINAIMDGLKSHFTDREAVWGWTELGRRVNGCHSAYIEYYTTYDIPRTKFHEKADTVVNYEYEHGRWLGVADQGTLLELTTS